jgi:hypothetical protein
MSTLKVDTYLTRGGASEIAIDKLKGVTAAGSMLVVGEGGTVTTNLQQGLGKSWINFNGEGTIATRDSLNVTSITDNGTGDYYVTIANDMASVNYSTTTAGRVGGGVSTNDAGENTATRLALGALGADGGRGDIDTVCATVHGDLA